MNECLIQTSLLSYLIMPLPFYCMILLYKFILAFVSVLYRMTMRVVFDTRANSTDVIGDYTTS